MSGSHPTGGDTTGDHAHHEHRHGNAGREFDRHYWEQRYHGAGSASESEPNPHLIGELAGLPPGTALTPAAVRARRRSGWPGRAGGSPPSISRRRPSRAAGSTPIGPAATSPVESIGTQRI